MGDLVGVGIDAVELDRFRRALARTPTLAERLFTADEQAYGDAAADPTPRMAARFAAKEAVMKALGVGLGAFGFHDVEVARADSGAPTIALSGRAASLAAEQGITRMLVSLTHTDRTAHAVAIAST